MQESQLPCLWLTFLLCLLPSLIAAQQNSSIKSPEEDESLDSATMAILVLVVVSAILFIGSFSLWIQNCCVDSSYSSSRSRSRSRSGSGSGSGSRVRVGVDKEIIDSFPTIVYSEEKGMKMGVECAVCLSEFSEEEILLIVPSCDHVFHVYCIGRWLANHTTCPVCRAGVMGIPLGDGVKEAEAKLKVKRWSSCENLSGEGSKSEIGRWIGRSERWSSTVAPLEDKGDGAGDRFNVPPV